MASSDDRQGLAETLQQARNRLDQTALLARYLGASIYSNTVTFLLGAILVASVLHGYSVAQDVEMYERRVMILEQNLNELEAELKGEIRACQQRDASSSFPR